MLSLRIIIKQNIFRMVPVFYYYHSAEYFGAVDTRRFGLTAQCFVFLSLHASSVAEGLLFSYYLTWVTYPCLIKSTTYHVSSCIVRTSLLPTIHVYVYVYPLFYSLYYPCRYLRHLQSVGNCLNVPIISFSTR